jgi:polyhydroxybutyrate depolymerase
MRLAGIAPVDGVRFPSPCKIPRPTPVIAFHGTADATNPYDGGDQAPWTYGVESAVGRWAANDACAPSAASSRPAPGVVLTDYEGCAEGAVVKLYAVDGMGHEWPGGPPVTSAQAARLGAQSNAIDANAVMWEFFAAHRAP